MKRTIVYGSLAFVFVASAGLWLALHTPSDTLFRSITVNGVESATPESETTTADSSNGPSRQYDVGSWNLMADGQPIIDSEIEQLHPFARKEFRITLMEDRLIPKSWHDRVIVYGGPHNPNSLAHKSPVITSFFSPYPIDTDNFELVYPDAPTPPSTRSDR